MRKTNWTPSIVPNGNDQTVYLVAVDFGKNGPAWREADCETADLETVVQDLLTGQYNNPIRVIVFNTAERWSEDVSEDVAHELRRPVTFSRASAITGRECACREAGRRYAAEQHGTTTGNAMKPDASQQGAPTGAAVGARAPQPNRQGEAWRLTLTDIQQGPGQNRGPCLSFGLQY
jgi:hypothetical protein